MELLGKKILKDLSGEAKKEIGLLILDRCQYWVKVVMN